MRDTGLILEASPTTLRDDPLLFDFVESVVSQLVDPRPICSTCSRRSS
jgi:hypothetical protein